MDDSLAFLRSKPMLRRRLCSGDHLGLAGVRLPHIMGPYIVCGLTGIAACYLAYTSFQFSLFAVRVLAALSLAGLVWTLYSAAHLTRDIFNPFTVFILGSYLFHCSQIWIAAAGVHSINQYFTLLDHGLPGSVFVQAATYCVLGLSVFSLCGLLGLTRLRATRQLARITEQHDQSATTLLRLLTLVMFLVTLAARVYCDSERFSLAMQDGYLSIYSIERRGWLLPLLDSSFSMAIAANVISFRCHIWLRRIFFSGGIAYALVSMAVIGNRGEQVSSIILLFWAHHAFVRPFARRDYRLAIAAALVLLLLCSIVSMTRMQSRHDLAHANYFTDLKERNLILSSFAEIGGTLLTPMFAVECIPSDLSFGCGASYVSAGLIQIPGAAHLIPWIRDNYSMANTLNKFGAPLGGSYIAETYFNFSWYGVIVMGALGWGVSAVTRIAHNRRLSMSIISPIMLLAIVQGLFMFVRDESFTLWFSASKALAFGFLGVLLCGRRSPAGFGAKWKLSGRPRTTSIQASRSRF